MSDQNVYVVVACNKGYPRDGFDLISAFPTKSAAETFVSDHNPRDWNWGWFRVEAVEDRSVDSGNDGVVNDS